MGDSSQNALLARDANNMIDKEFTTEKALLNSLINKLNHKTNIKKMEK